MHSKQKGSIGEAKIIHEFLKSGFNVFTDFGDNSKIDMIIERDYELIKIQVKSITSEDDRIYLSRRKSGPNYKFSYTINDADIFAVYILDTDQVFFVSSKDLCEYKCGMTFRIKRFSSKNNQEHNVRYIEDYTLERILRDYTPNILTSYVEDDDIVQTTTNIKNSVSES